MPFWKSANYISILKKSEKDLKKIKKIKFKNLTLHKVIKNSWENITYYCVIFLDENGERQDENSRDNRNYIKKIK